MADLTGTAEKPQKKMTAYLIVFSVIVLLVLPMFSGTILSAAYEFVLNDIIYEDYDTAIGIIISICTVLSEFAGYAIIIYVFMSELKARKRIFVALTLVSYFITFLCTLFINYLSGASFFSLLWIYISFALLSFVISAAVLFLFLYILKKKECSCSIPDLAGKLVSGKNPCLSSAALVSVIWLIIKIISSGIDTVYLIIDYGVPATVGDVIYLVTPYVENIILAVIGYFITVGLMYVFSAKHRKYYGDTGTDDNEVQISN